MASSVIAWRGPSAFDGREVQVVLTGLEHPSTNEKTGPMVQAYILPADQHPVEAARDGAASICGSCPGRRTAEGWCYVSSLPLLAIGRALRDRRMPTVGMLGARAMVAGKPLRLGAYGDPAAVPYAFWKQLTGVASRWTGYTHAWRTCDPRFALICMASVEDQLAATQALARGYRYFRLRVPGSMKLPSEVVCPATVKDDVTCAKCGLCDGVERSAKRKSIVIDAHGPAANYFRQPGLL